MENVTIEFYYYEAGSYKVPDDIPTQMEDPSDNVEAQSIVDSYTSLYKLGSGFITSINID